MWGMGLRRAGVVAAAVAGATAVAPATSAAAADVEYCSGNYTQEYYQAKKIALPGKPDITVYVDLCLYNHVGSYQAISNVSWDGGFIVGKRFNSFTATVWVQKNDVNKCTGTGYPSINSYDSGSLAFTCAWQSANTSGVSADGKIVYDIANDGKGAYTWQLTGTS
ncbi:hypothetical protein ACIA5D_31460 [Actinoplanes sp. NPDC051513]|uniref:hypothetical protein n=1 Tax=Actinoplanes sp. NPDC051513 TaxID=3363908 RepID=UPI003789E5DC